MNFVKTDDNPYKVTLEAFEGPLDLLLHLIRENKIDIYDIPIAKITQQYLEYLALMESMDLDVAGEWLVMAATLIEIKSRTLLPKEPKEEQNPDADIDPRMELVERLIEYERFKGAAEIFRERETQRSKVFMRGSSELDIDLKPKFVLEDITAQDLLNTLSRILADVDEEEVTTLQRRKITVRMRIREIWRRVSESAGQLTFNELFDDVESRIEIVITFLALLELLKMRKVKVRQKHTYAAIEIIALQATDEAGEEKHWIQ